MKPYKKISLIFLIAFTLNLIWEYSHFQLYFDLSGIPKHQHLFLATFTDAIIITSIFLIVTFLSKSYSWMKKTRPRDYALIVALCLSVAIFIETRALRIERWAYKDAMPTIFGLGLSPLTQLWVTAILTLFILRKFIKN